MKAIEQEPIPWMTPEETERFVKELKTSLGRGREIKKTSYQDYLEAKMYLTKDLPDGFHRLFL